MEEDFSTVYPSGIHGRTGKRFHEAFAVEELARVLREGQPRLTNPEREAARHLRGEDYGLPFGASPKDLRSVGWGIVYAPDTPPQIRAALAPLIALRKSQASKYLFEIEYKAGEAAGAFLRRHNVAWGTINPSRLPYHLVLVGSPEAIPFEFQYQLDLEYSVGRIHFDDPSGAAHAAYARHVVDYETGVTKTRRKEVGFFAPAHSGDACTQSALRNFIKPLAEDRVREDNPLYPMVDAQPRLFAGPDATRDRLQTLLAGGSAQPAVLWTAGHGMAFDATDSEQTQLQGALLTSDWSGFDKLERQHYLAGMDIAGDADLRGLVAFLFACFGTGTPRLDSYPTVSGARRELAPQSFVAALPQAMMARGALAVIGHVDVAYGHSFKPRGVTVSQLGPYNDCLGHLLFGNCLGTATCNLTHRAATLGAQIADTLAPGATPTDATELALLWCERNDARGYILLGDPAIRLRFD